MCEHDIHPPTGKDSEKRRVKNLSGESVALLDSYHRQHRPFSTTLHNGGSREACHTTPPKREHCIMNKTQSKPKSSNLPRGASINQLLEGMHYAVDNIRWALIVRDRE